MPADFIHLRVHTSYSLSEGAIRLVEPHAKGNKKKPREDLMHLCLAQKMPAFAFTDKNNMFGAQESALYAPSLGLQPIVGTEVCVCWDDAALGKKPVLDRLVLLAQNQEGYENLCALVSAAFLATDRIDIYVTRAEVEKYTKGVIALSAGIEGTIGRLLLEGQKEAAVEVAKRLAALYPSRFYIDIERHLSGDIGQKERKIEPDLLEIAYAQNLPLVATNNVYFGERKQYEAHDALLCIADKTVLVDPNRRRMTPEHYFKSAAEMRALFADLPEACDNTVVIAKRCAFMPPMRKPILPVFQAEAGRDEAAELRAQAEEGLRMRLKTNGITEEGPYWDRLNYEMDIITKMKFPGYFLIVSDFIKWAKSQHIPVGPGRGSGAGSIVAWALLITDLNPLRFNLLFERFLNPERVSMPDFDVDFCQGRREEVIGYVQRRYGKDCVAQIITFGQLQARAVLRDVGRVLGMPYGYVDKICKLVPSNPANPISLGEALEMEPQLQQLRENDETVGKLIAIALQLEGLFRNASTHAAGVVIGNRRLVELVPLYRDPSSPWPATQFNMKVVELAGLVKFDFLGLKTLDVLQQTVDFIAEEGETIDLSTIPLDDEKTFKLLSKGDTTGVFQFESSGMRDVLRRLQPNRFDDIVALVALYRPGPMDNIPKYIACKKGEEEIDCLHPLLEPVLKETFGIMIYQEQVMQSAQRLAGYSLGAADLLRRAMGKKKVEEMAAQRANFIAGAAKNGLDAAQASRIFDQIDKFAGYGFNKSHAAAYSIVSYRTAWLKTHYIVPFMAASMNFEMADTDKLNNFRQELVRHGVPLLPPDVNASDVIFRPEKLPDGRVGIRYALAALKGVGDQAMQALVEARKKGGPFKDLFDLVERVDCRAINRKQLEGLVMGGAFDGIDKNRARIVASLDLLLKHGHTLAEERASGQMNMFGGGSAASRPALPKVKPWDDLTKLQHEFQALGFYLSAHPLDTYRALLDRLGVISVSEVDAKMKVGGPSRFKLAGIVLARQEKTAKSGNRFAFLQASDTSGAFEVTVFSELLASRRDILEPGESVLMEVDAQGSGTDLRFIGRNFEKISDVAARLVRGVRIRLFDAEDVAEIKKELDEAPKGTGKVTLALELDEDVAEIELAGGWQLSEKLKQSLRQVGNGLEVQEC